MLSKSVIVLKKNIFLIYLSPKIPGRKKTFSYTLLRSVPSGCKMFPLFLPTVLTCEQRFHLP